MRNLTQRLSHGPTTWKDMLKSAVRDIVNWQTKRQQLYKVSTPCLDDHNFKKELETVRELTDACSQNSLEMLVMGSNR